MAERTLGKGHDREVEKLSLRSGTEEEKTFAALYAQQLQTLPKTVRDAFADWVYLYTKDDLSLTKELFKLVEGAVTRYGDSFVASFYVCGTRWRELSFFQFQQIFEVMDQEYEKSVTKRSSIEVKVKARHKAANDGARLMRLFLHYPLADNDEKAAFLRNVLVSSSKETTEMICFLLKRRYFKREYFEEALSVLECGNLELAHRYLDACENWSLTAVEAVTLSANLIYLLNQQGGESSCFKLLEKKWKPTILGEGPESYH